MRDLAHVPDFIIGGSPRSGTTWLAQNLAQHAQIWMLKPLIPEPKIFILGGEVGEIAWKSRLENAFSQAPINCLAGEKTSNYLESREAPRRICTILPTVKLFFILREPVSRAWSNFLWSRQNGLEQVDFETACEIEFNRPDPMPPEKSHARPYDYQRRGQYGTLLENWLAYFPRKQICLLRYEDIRPSPQALLNQATRFLELPPATPDTQQNEIVNPTSEQSMQLCENLKMKLKSRFIPEMLKLQDLMGFDITPWGY